MANRNIELVIQKITGYLSDIKTLHSTIEQLKLEKSNLERDLKIQKSEVRELEKEKSLLLNEIDILKEQIKPKN